MPTFTDELLILQFRFKGFVLFCCLLVESMMFRNLESLGLQYLTS